MIAVGAIATYTTVGNVTAQVLVIILGYLSVGSISMALWLQLGASLQNLLRNQKQLQLFNIIMALLLVFSVISMATTELNTLVQK